MLVFLISHGKFHSSLILEKATGRFCWISVVGIALPDASFSRRSLRFHPLLRAKLQQSLPSTLTCNASPPGGNFSRRPVVSSFQNKKESIVAQCADTPTTRNSSSNRCENKLKEKQISLNKRVWELGAGVTSSIQSECSSAEMQFYFCNLKSAGEDFTTYAHPQTHFTETLDIATTVKTVLCRSVKRGNEKCTIMPG